MRNRRLYYDQPYLKEFEASIISKQSKGNLWEVILDRTAFYPTSGGQPFDTGTINGVPVVDVIERDDEIVHILTGDPGSDMAKGQIDWERRLDHTQQHAGQHILSQAFVQLMGAETVGFHLGLEAVTIDLNTPSLDSQQAARVEQQANEIIWSGRKILCHWATPDQLAQFPLRKAPTVTTDIRIVEVEGYDWSPCGGTHPENAAEVGLIKIRRWEKSKGQVRVEFVCGNRALKDYRWKNELVVSLATQLSVKDLELSDALARQSILLRDLQRDLNRSKEKLLEYEALDLHDQATKYGELNIVTSIFEGREFADVKTLANKLIGLPRTIALLGIAKENPQFLFARSQDLPQDMNQLVKQMINRFGGKGGGTPASAQGAGGQSSQLAELLDLAKSAVMR